MRRRLVFVRQHRYALGVDRAARKGALAGLAFAVAAGVLALPALSTAPAAAATGVSAGSVAGSKPVAALPDEVSARIAARSQGSRVEVTDDRTETTTTWANPDGTLTVDSAIAPVRVQKDDGSWRPVDYDLVQNADGTFAPKASPVDVTFSGGGEGPAATADKGSKELDLSLNGPLPKPTIEGNEATYKIDDNTNLVLAATATGLEESYVLAKQPDASDLDALGMQLDTTGVVAAPATDQAGAVNLDNASGKNAGKTAMTIGAPVVYDARRDRDGDPTNAITVPNTLTPADPTDPSPSAPAQGPVAAPDDTQVLGVTDAAGQAPAALTSFLSDPSTVYPVTIDPPVTINPSADTWIQQGDTTAHGGDYNVKIGDVSGNHRRALLNFPTSTIPAGKTVISATLNLFNTVGNTCTAEPINAYPITTAWAASVDWANKPDHTGSYSSGSSWSHGYSSASCPNGWGAIDVTGMVNAWYTGALPDYGLMLEAGDETADVQDKTMCSHQPSTSAAACNSVTKIPYIAVTYNTVPSVPTTPTVSTLPGLASSAGYSISTTPTVATTLIDADGGVRANFTITQVGGGVVWTGSTAFSSTSNVSLQVPAGKLVNGQKYTVTATAQDAYVTTAASAATTFTVDTTPPAASISATKYVDGQWNTAAPSGDTFTLTGPADTKSFSYTLDGGAPTVVAANTSGGASFAWTPAKGTNTITVTATDKAGNTGPAATVSFGSGAAGISNAQSHPTSTGVFPLQATAPAGATGASVRWRFAGSSAWNHVTASTVTRVADGSIWDGSVAAGSDGSGTISTTPQLAWDATSQDYTDSTTGAAVKISAPALIDLQVCFTYPSGGSPCATEPGVQLVPSGFGGNRPTTDVGPASVALTTGEMSLTESDAVDQTAGIGRSFSSYGTGTLRTGPFGPGWTTTLDASTDSAAKIVDNRAQDRTFVLVTAGNASQMYAPTAASIDPTNPGAYPSGVSFAPVGIDDGSRLLLSSDGQTLTLTHQLGDQTGWTYDTTAKAWNLTASTSDPNVTSTNTDGSATQTTVTYTGTYPTWIAETSPGNTTACTPADQEPGCRAFRLTYTGSGSATRLSTIDLITGAVGGTGTATPQATYSYTNGLLTTACGPDPDGSGPQTPLCESYTYDTTTISGRTLLASLTPPGEATWTFHYDNRGRLATVTRPEDADAGGGTALWMIDYDLTPSTPDLSASAVAVWGQTDVPTHGYAVFSPGYTPASSPTADDLKHAALWFTDANGRTTNTATYGTVVDPAAAGTSSTSRWLIDSTTYDTNGNVTATLEPAGVIAAQDAQSTAKAGGATDTDALTAAQQVAKARSAFTVYSSDGSRVSDEYGPAHTATLDNGTTGTYRAHRHYVYDDEAPDLGGVGKPSYPAGTATFNLVVEVDKSAADPAMTPGGIGDRDVIVTRNSYAKVVATDRSGWDIGVPTQTSVRGSDGTFTVTSTTRFDQSGNQVESRLPGGSTGSDGSGNDARSTLTTYYTSTNADADCEINGHPERAGWDGLVCKSGPATQLTNTTISGTAGGVAITWNKAFDAALQPTLVVDSSGSGARTTSIEYDGLERPTRVSVTDGHDTRVESYGYDQSTGQQNAISGGGSSTDTGGPIKVVLDSWGRTESYADSGGAVTTTTYTKNGEKARTSDASGSTSYKYSADGADTLSALTATADGVSATFTLEYDPNSNPARVTYGSAMVASCDYDDAGNTTSVSYANTSNDVLVYSADILDVNGLARESSSTASHQNYAYDGLGRLVNVEEIRDSTCTTRAYGFDATSNRTAVNTFSSDASGACQSSKASASRAWSYDDASRHADPGYSFDGLGRTRTIPAIDTVANADSKASTLSVGYYANDMAESLTQTVNGTGSSPQVEGNDFSLDPTGRVLQVTTTLDSVETASARYEFSDDSDSPSSVTSYVPATASQPAKSSMTRYVTVGTLGMVASIDDAGVTYHPSNLHGDAVAAVDQSGTIRDYSENDEYGNPVNPASDAPQPDADRYGYLGSAQRTAGLVGGLILMGARLYNPRTGSFLSPDPVVGANRTPYAYPVDPVNSADTSGACPVCVVIVGVAVEDLIAAALAGGLVIAGIKIAQSTVKAYGYTVPFPGKDVSNKGTGYSVYAIRYYKPGDSHGYIWKYGITGVGEERPQSQLNTCTSQMNSPIRCTYEWRATGLSKWKARALEATLIGNYLKEYHHCPPGHRSMVCT